ncbi:hypothetical protein D3C80_1231310 [compost metagenome]
MPHARNSVFLSLITRVQRTIHTISKRFITKDYPHWNCSIMTLLTCWKASIGNTRKAFTEAIFFSRSDVITTKRKITKDPFNISNSSTGLPLIRKIRKNTTSNWVTLISMRKTIPNPRWRSSKSKIQAVSTVHRVCTTTRTFAIWTVLTKQLWKDLKNY